MATETCDHCGPTVPALSHWTKGLLEITLCGHHTTKLALTLVGKGWTKLVDDRPTPAPPAQRERLV